MTKKNPLLILAVVAALLVPITFIAVFAGSVVMGTVVGVGSALQTLPVTCKAPPNIFKAWESFENFLIGQKCQDECDIEAGDVGGEMGNGNMTTYATTIVAVGKAMKIPKQGINAALATVIVESGFKNYANDGVYDTSRNFADATIAGQMPGILKFAALSLKYPHDAVGSDATSVGLFQQQAWWGTVGNSNWENDPENTMKRLMSPAFQAQKFYDRMVHIPGWQTMNPGTLAQKVQVSAFPDRYNQVMPQAISIHKSVDAKANPASVKLHNLGTPVPGEGATAGAEENADCGSVDASGPGIVLDKNSLYHVTEQWGSPRAIEPHTGMDIDCGDNFENVYTPIGGVVLISVNGNSSGFGMPMGEVIIKMPDGSNARFMHMAKTFVKPGSQLKAGTAIGQCASTGMWTTGTHLHVEVDVKHSKNAKVRALPRSPIMPGWAAETRDPAMYFNTMGVDICPPYTRERYANGIGSELSSWPLKCWPPQEWTR